MDRTEYELRKLVLMVGTQRAFAIIRNVEKDVCPPATEESINRPSDNGGNVVHVPFGQSRGRQLSSTGSSAVARELFALNPSVTAADIRAHIQAHGLTCNAKTVQVEVSKLRTKARAA